MLTNVIDWPIYVTEGFEMQLKLKLKKHTLSSQYWFIIHTKRLMDLFFAAPASLNPILRIIAPWCASLKRQQSKGSNAAKYRVLHKATILPLCKLYEEVYCDVA